MLKEKTLVEILWEVWEKQPEAFHFLSADDKQELVTEASLLDKDIKKSLSFKQKVRLSNAILNLYLKGRNSRKEQVEISAPIDFSKPLQKYVEMAKMASSNEPYFQVVGEYKFNRLIGKVMQVIEMLPLDDQKQEATKAVLKDYLHDCMNENNCIRVDIFRELQKDGLPTEEHIYG